MESELKLKARGWVSVFQPISIPFKPRSHFRVHLAEQDIDRIRQIERETLRAM